MYQKFSSSSSFFSTLAWVLLRRFVVTVSVVTAFSTDSESTAVVSISFVTVLLAVCLLRFTKSGKIELLESTGTGGLLARSPCRLAFWCFRKLTDPMAPPTIASSCQINKAGKRSKNTNFIKMGDFWVKIFERSVTKPFLSLLKMVVV